jgi:hypothetical protein
MKKLIVILFLFFVIQPTFAQSDKNPEDSTAIYQKELSALWRSFHDSLRNSERFRQLSANIRRTRSVKDNYGAFVLYAPLHSANFTRLNKRQCLYWIWVSFPALWLALV